MIPIRHGESSTTGASSALVRVRRLSLAACAGTFALLLAGATVSATGAGLACPDWPLCHGRLIPPFDRLVLIEYGHRLLASVVGLLVVALVALVWRPAARPWRLRGWGLAAVGLLVLQVGLGGVTVLSALVPLVVGTHLVVAMTFMAVLVAFTARAHWGVSDPDAARVPAGTAAAAAGATARAVAGAAGAPGLAAAARAALALTFVQVALGGYTSAFGAGLACPDFPLCRGGLVPPADPMVWLHYVHRLVAFTLTVTVAVVAARARAAADPVARRLASAAVLAVIVQVALGAANVWTRVALPVRIAHLGGAAALLGLLVALAVRVRAVSALAPATAPAARVADYVALTKPRIVVLLLLTTATTMVVAAGGPVAAALLAYTLLGGALAAGAANAINCYWDRDIDAIMRRTRGRPIPARRVTPGRALAFGGALALAAVLLLGTGVNWLAAGLAAAGIAFYVGVYTVWLKRSTPQNIVIGGAAGAVPPLVGWAAVRGEVGLPALVLFAIIFLWTPPHFWALALDRAEDYRAARVPMLPVVRGIPETVRQIVRYTAALVAATFVLAGVAGLGRVYLVSAALLAAPFVVLALRLARAPSPRRARELFGYSIVYLGLLFLSMAADRLAG